MRNKWRPHSYGNKRFTNLTLLVDMMMKKLWKSITDTQIAANHIESYFKTVMGAVIQYAVSYPYDKK